jgi:hypothetical protein
MEMESSSVAKFLFVPVDIVLALIRNPQEVRAVVQKINKILSSSDHDDASAHTFKTTSFAGIMFVGNNF